MAIANEQRPWPTLPVPPWRRASLLIECLDEATPLWTLADELRRAVY